MGRDTKIENGTDTKKDFEYWTSWNSLLKYAFVITLLFMLSLGGFCVWKVLTPRTTELKLVMINNPNRVPQMQAENAKMDNVSLESYKATYDLFNSQFSQLLVMLGFFGSVFGLLIPAGAYLLQRQSLNDERDRIKKELRDEIEDSQKKIDEQILKVNNIYNSDMALIYQGLQNSNVLEFFRMPSTPILGNFLISFDNVINYFTKARCADKVQKSIKNGIEFIDNMKKRCPDKFDDMYKTAAETLNRAYEPSDKYVTGKDIADLIGKESEEYKFFEKTFSSIYPLKFNN